MFVKLTRSGSRRYVQLVESYRDEAGKPRQRTILGVVMREVQRKQGAQAHRSSTPNQQFRLIWAYTAN